ncbi:hypothetical protein ES708_31070 [subsurface metagenome]
MFKMKKADYVVNRLRDIFTNEEIGKLIEKYGIQSLYFTTIREVVIKDEKNKKIKILADLEKKRIQYQKEQRLAYWLVENFTLN